MASGVIVSSSAMANNALDMAFLIVYSLDSTLRSTAHRLEHPRLIAVEWFEEIEGNEVFWPMSRRLEISLNRMTEIVLGKRGITADTALWGSGGRWFESSHPRPFRKVGRTRRAVATHGRSRAVSTLPPSHSPVRSLRRTSESGPIGPRSMTIASSVAARAPCRAAGHARPYPLPATKSLEFFLTLCLGLTAP